MSKENCIKLIHLFDLHLGKRVKEYPILEDQQYIPKKIIGVIDDETPNGVIVAGDVYDKSVPSAEAVQLFDDFLVSPAKRKLQFFVISSNHDSPERIAFASRMRALSSLTEFRITCCASFYGCRHPVLRTACTIDGFAKCPCKQAFLLMV